MEVRRPRTDQELEEALGLRERVFCGEQGVSVQADRDGRDSEATAGGPTDGTTVGAASRAAETATISARRRTT